MLHILMAFSVLSAVSVRSVVKDTPSLRLVVDFFGVWFSPLLFGGFFL